jgi:hypothetical protein
MEHYDAILNFIKTYNLTHEEDIFTRGIEKNVFITLADSVCEIVDDEKHNDTKIDYNRIVENTYNKIFVPIIRNLIDMNEKMQSQLEDVLKHGQKVTLVVKDVDKTVELIKEAKTPNND